MAKILIWKDYNPGNHVDVFRQLDYNILHSEIERYCDGINTNTGNKVWMQGLISEISCDNNTISFYDKKENWEYINSNYDLIIFSTANLICKEYKSSIKRIAREFKNCKIPIYVISIGAQAEGYEDIKNVCSDVGDEIKELIDAIYMTKGEFALRGWFTKEIFDKIAFNTAVVTGCPSLYQNGRDLFIHNCDVNMNDINLALNGDWKYIYMYMTEKLSSYYVDQDIWYKEIFCSSFWQRDEKQVIKDIVRRYGIKQTNLFLNDRIKQFYDVAEWKAFFDDKKIDFSFGSRIHGNIMSILSGVPALVIAKDTRTKEMAEFFEIPFISIEEINKPLSYLLNKADYSMFNKNFKIKYDNYREFLVSHKIVNDINQNNIFWNKKLPIQNELINKRKNECNNYCKKHSLYFELFDIKQKLNRLF